MIVICLDDSGRPEDIPTSLWVKRGSEYTVISSYKDMNGIPLFELLEIDLASLGTLYKGFAANRFKPLDSFLDDLVEEINLKLENYQYAD